MPNKPHRRLPALLLALLCTALGPAAAPADDSTAARIARVESGLLPPAILARPGAVPETWTLAARMAEHHIPGVSVAVIDRNQIAWARGYGVARSGDPAPVTPDTLFQAASISKTVAAVTTLALVDAGRLTLDADANTLLRTWQLPAAPVADGETVTVRRLLSHTAGLSVHGFAGYAAGAALPTLPQILDGAPPANSDPIRVLKKPGTTWLYSGGGYVVLQQLLADITGTSYADLARDHVLLPAGLHASALEQPLAASLAPLAAAGHDADAVRLTSDAHVYPELAAAGLWTTPTDLARLLLAVGHDLNASDKPLLLSPAAAAQLVTVPLAGSDYGLGVGVKNSGPTLQLNHTGSNAGFRAIYVFYPHLGRGAVIMTNSDNGGRLIPELLRALAREYDWPDYRVVEKRAVAFAPEAFDDFAGRYERDETVLVFYRKDSHFYLRATNTPRVEIFPKSNHEFFQLGSDVTYSFARDEILRVTHVVRSDPSPQLFRRTTPTPE